MVGQICMTCQRAWLPERRVHGRLGEVKGKLHSWCMVSNTWNGSWQPGESFFFPHCAHATRVLVRVWVCMSSGETRCEDPVRGRCYWAFRHSSCAREETGWQKKTCVCEKSVRAHTSRDKRSSIFHTCMIYGVPVFCMTAVREYLREGRCQM